MKIKVPTGMRDLLGDDLKNFRDLESAWKNSAEQENFSEIITPILEEKSLFVRSVGEFSDIVSKEMFECEDLVLRPEGTAPVMRCVLEKNLPVPQKFFYYAPFFRKERPQKGRFRQFYQYGIEILGENSPQAEIETLKMIQTFYGKLNVKFRFEVNYIPAEAELKSYESSLAIFYKDNEGQLSTNAKEKLAKGSILRILDSKEDKTLNESAPQILNFLSEKEKEEWNLILKLLTTLNISFKINPALVRGLDYYQGFVFEVVDESNTLGSQNALGGGGRYNKLSTQLESKEPISAFGFGGGVERLLYQVDFPAEAKKTKVGFICTESSEVETLCRLKDKLQVEGLIVDICFDFNLGFKKMFKRLDRMNFDYAVIIGKNEIDNNFYKIKNLATGVEVTILEAYGLISSLKILG